MKILVTGGTGSFGKKMVDRLLSVSGVDLVRVFSRDELKQHDMRGAYGDSDKLEFFIGDVRDKNSLIAAIENIDVVFHAAALKQVPTGEFFPSEMVNTNINGTRNLIDVIEYHGNVKKAILLSTDKAVFPINTMGLTKAIAEKLFLAASKSSKVSYNIVRYGNVMASRGSVIPLFIDKILSGDPLPITDKNMTRFLLSLDDAIDLVLYAIENGKSGDLFVRKAPAATVESIAKGLSTIFHVEYKSKIIGTRAGEKMHETLVTSGELVRAIDTGDYFQIKPETNRLDYGNFFTEGKLINNSIQDFTSDNTKRLNQDETIELLNSLDLVQNIKKQLQDKNA